MLSALESYVKPVLPTIITFHIQWGLTLNEVMMAMFRAYKTYEQFDIIVHLKYDNEYSS